MPRYIMLWCALSFLSGMDSSAQETCDSAAGRPQSGATPPCWNGKPAFAPELDNYLIINVGRGLDVACKLVNEETESCIRFVYVRAGETVAVKNIPEGRYGVKIAFGSEWRADTAGGACSGRFRKDAFYQRGRETLDFTVTRTETGLLVPSFELMLETPALKSAGEFPTQDIKEAEFVK